MPLKGLGRRLFNLIADAIDYAWETIESFLEKFWDLNKPGAIALLKFLVKATEEVGEVVINLSKKAWELNKPLIEDIAGGLGRKFNNAIKGGRSSVFDTVTAYMSAGNYDPQIKSALAKYFHESNDIAQLIAFMGIPSAIFSTIFQAETSSYILRSQQADAASDLTGILDVGTILQMWNRQGADRGLMTDSIRRAGLPPGLSASIDAASKQWMPLAQLAIAAQHGDSSAGLINEAALNQGYSSAQVEAAKSLAKNWPDLNMAAQAAVRDPKFLGLMSDIAKSQGLPSGSTEAALLAAKEYLNPIQLQQAAIRGGISVGEADKRTIGQGFDQTDATAAKALARTMLTPITLVNALWRDEIGTSEYQKKMIEAGYSQQDADTFLQTAFFLPTPSDLITWESKEVFENDSITKYGLDDEFERLQLDLFAKIGISKEQAKNYWIAHWQHPSFTQVGEMFIRDVLTSPTDRDNVKPGSPEWKAVRARAEEEVFEWFRLVEVPPYWRKRMNAIIYQPYTRVDIRRMWDLDVVEDDDVVRAYLDQGYDLDHAQNLLAFTKVERGFPDLVARYRNGWINQADVLSTLMGYGVSPETATRLFQRKFANLEQPTRIATERDLTKTEIIAGVKKELLTDEQASQMLMRLGYDEFEAQFLVLVNTEFVGSPESPLGFRRGAEAYRKALGQDYVDIPKDVIDLEKQVMVARKALTDAEFTKQSISQIDALRTALARLQSTFDLRKRQLNL